MDGMALLLDLGLHFALVLTPSVVAGLALQRVTASRSRNRLLYGAIALVSSGLALNLLTDIMSGLPLAPLPALAALGTLPGWGLILWVASGPGTGQYRARTDWRPFKALPPLLLAETVRVERWRALDDRTEPMPDRVTRRPPVPDRVPNLVPDRVPNRVSAASAPAAPKVGAVAVPTFHTGQVVPPEPRWRPTTPLVFVPGAGGVR